MPHKDRVEGYVSSSKPLSLRGQLIEDIQVRFSAGKVVEARARQGQGVLQQLLETDEGARRLGEVALVPHSSPVSSTQLLFYNTLFDENAASHIAFGEAYSENLEGHHQLSQSELSQRGFNQSLIHEDWMIGSEEMDVDAVNQTGGLEPLMRQGEWVS
jgi:aminopeptidase